MLLLAPTTHPQQQIEDGSNIPFNVDSAKSSTVCQLIPRTNREVEVVLIARSASVLHSRYYRVAFPSNAIIATNIGDLDHTSTERSWGLAQHPKVTDSNDQCPIRVCLSAWTSSCEQIEVRTGCEDRSSVGGWERNVPPSCSKTVPSPSWLWVVSHSMDKDWDVRKPYVVRLDRGAATVAVARVLMVASPAGTAITPAVKARMAVRIWGRMLKVRL